MSTESPRTERNVRDELLRVAVDILNQDGPDGLQTRKIASAAGTSTMAVYTYFSGLDGDRNRLPALRDRTTAHVPVDVR
jgi:AcrR family transcriptional regulator